MGFNSAFKGLIPLFTLHSQYPRACQYIYFHITQQSLDAEISPSTQRAHAAYIE